MAEPTCPPIAVASRQRARDQACAAVREGEMCVVVTGLPGTGKTVLVDSVARTLRSTGWRVVIAVAGLPAEARIAGLEGRAAILIDDADRLSAAELRTLNRLRRCSVVLAGAVGLEKRCAADRRVTLEPLTAEEVDRFVAAWLEQAGLGAEAIDDDALAQLAEVSAGIPRALGLLLAGSVAAARAEAARRIEPHHIDAAAWHQVEHSAARRLARSSPAPVPKAHSVGAPLIEAPFFEPDTGAPDRSRTGWLIGVTVALLVAAGVMLAGRWSPAGVTPHSAASTTE